MKFYFYFFFALILMVSCKPKKKISKDDSNPKTEILNILDQQTKAWNRGDLNSFMIGYWNNDSLKFIGKNGIKYGWQTTLDNYKKSYSDTIQMGKLNFKIISLEVLSKESAFVIGKWHLKRSIGDLSGHYTLLFKRINEKWVIVADHSS